MVELLKNVLFCTSTRLFCYITYVPLNARDSGNILVDLKFHNLSPFLHIFNRFFGFLIKKGTHFEILNLNNWTVRLKVHVI